ncbi:MAG: gliding motility-associated ABC transporter ATP-binding subunit GldA [Bacteroidetes bacterium RIFOXYA12_FULL_35_11]|nr:MAG: gliding motility-associated ABC transporter ATP-binding subunit GldA [Bacteroidetes bacterium GWF2_35_48]OFY82941.1 MAG: gliding motility-associated ABC transporter ATP-binding subunit GldA [Bacteroidetes bacterium RIFOXYA12_FULL_35_11]OFY95266.1 MAG: gliding motility-associated ABC transporter ATP-binding subunit GldA [Bacteroidetes bacterium RIFOXYB2_FULL_35_7]OFZ04842.1 MAG: gliding motility-associated ABC transporter ATP-binding subunit GldA [Bacteroidetes bacterium RIFOXYC12_FULL_35
MDIVVENLTKTYGPQRAVDNISFQVKTGEVLGFLGPNGAGKTTTMKAITCFLSPTDGDIKVGGNSVLSNPDKVKKLIGYLPEMNPLYVEMPVIDYLKFVAELQGIHKNKIRERIKEMVTICGLEGEKHKKISELSKGYRQRVGLAQALIHDPEVLVLDEPTAGLDPNQIAEIRALIRSIGRSKTVVLSSHILAEVEATCDRILIINKGKIVADGTADDLRKRAHNREVLRISIEGADSNTAFQALRAVDTIDLIDPLPMKECSFEIHSKNDATSRKAIFSLCVEKGWFLTEMTPIETKLEDIFRELTVN